MPMSRYQISKNSTSIAALSMSRCPSCKKIFHSSYKVMQKGKPCPVCRTVGVPEMVPNYGALRLLEMIMYFYAQAVERQKNLRIELSKEIKELTGVYYSPEEAVELHKKVRDYFKEHGGEEGALVKAEENLRYLVKVKGELCDYSRLHGKLLHYKTMKNENLLEEHKVIVILTCCLMEVLFTDLLMEILVENGETRNKAETKLNHKPLSGKKNLFCKKCKVLLKDIMILDGHENFYIEWDELVEKRNKFLHDGKTYRLNNNDADTAFDLAIDSFEVFRILFNKYGLGSKKRAAMGNGMVDNL